jgi:UDP-glucose 4-epimerase
MTPLNSKRSVLDRLETITSTHLPFIECDVRDTATLEETLKTHRIEAVIHFAGLKAVGESVEKPIEYYDNNIVGTVSLLKAMRAADVKTLVFNSNATVCGDPHICHWMKRIRPVLRTRMVAASFTSKRC